LQFPTLLAVSLLLLASPLAQAQKPSGTHCELAKPPETAGEATMQGAPMRIHPRILEISAKYNGCQTMWSLDRGTWTVVSVAEIKNGQPVRIWWPDPKKAGLNSCRYLRGKLVSGAPDKCPPGSSLLTKSLPPGCTVKLRDALAAGAVGAAWPKECQYE
jgi:hypothetical protein